jgi:hypothetical protein
MLPEMKEWKYDPDFPWYKKKNTYYSNYPLCQELNEGKNDPDFP